MQFLRTTFWVVIAVFLAILGRNNWSDVTLNLWGPFQADIKIPLLVLIVFLLGFLPTFLILRGRIWALKRRQGVPARPVEPIANPPAAPVDGSPTL
ncbi:MULTISPECIES: LapA family protein [Sphingomonas]|uniref:LapA family protein n=1 Tax=Sphingomonas TaxID=13687 RepID=UPI000DF00F43|nr:MULTISPECIES: LapA family protein [Sphingomonas]